MTILSIITISNINLDFTEIVCCCIISKNIDTIQCSGVIEYVNVNVNTLECNV